MSMTEKRIEREKLQKNSKTESSVRVFVMMIIMKALDSYFIYLMPQLVQFKGHSCEYREQICDRKIAEIEVGHVLSHEAKLEDDDHDKKISSKTTDKDDDVDECQENHPFQRQ